MATISRWDRKLSEFLDMLDRNEIRINRDYQRSGKVWPLNAKSYLVETVIMASALPHLMLHEVPGRRGSPRYMEIIDGQQRTEALRSFRQGEFRLSGAVDRKSLQGKQYSKLGRRDRKKFNDYVLRLDLFRNANASDIREIFRRINSYTVPLNPEEQRHARFQGEFKWFVHGQLDNFGDALKESGVLSEKQVNRMRDAKLLTEIIHALIHGITTTDARALKRLYKDLDKTFPREREIEARLSAGLPVYASWGTLPSSIAKPHHAYSLLLALLHAQQRIPTLDSLIRGRRKLTTGRNITANLDRLASMIERDEDDVPVSYQPFCRASAKGTNVRTARETRFRWYCRALTTDRVR